MTVPVSVLGDRSRAPADAHGCPACPHNCVGPAVSGSPDVMINGKPVLRVGDMGVHAACCGPNLWVAVEGSASVFVNGLPVHRKGDKDLHCGGLGEMIEGSADVKIGGDTFQVSPSEIARWLGLFLSMALGLFSGGLPPGEDEDCEQPEEPEPDPLDELLGGRHLEASYNPQMPPAAEPVRLCDPEREEHHGPEEHEYEIPNPDIGPRLPPPPGVPSTPAPRIIPRLVPEPFGISGTEDREKPHET